MTTDLKSGCHIIGVAGAWPYRPIPLVRSSVRAGFPSPAENDVEAALDLNELCVQHPASTFFVRVDHDADSMIGIGIYPHDILVVDRALTARHGDIVIALLHTEFTVKELRLTPHPHLLAHHEDYPPIPLDEDSAFEVWGVVTDVIRQLRRRGR